MGNNKGFCYIAYDRLGNRLTFVGERHCSIADLQNTLRIGAGEAIAVRSLDRSHYSHLSLYLMENYFMEYTEPDLIDRVLRALDRGHLRLVQLEYGAKDKEANAAIYVSLQQTLNSIIYQERASAAIAQEVFEQESIANKGLIYLGAFMHGASQSGEDLLKWLKEASDVVSPIAIAYNAYEAATTANSLDSFLTQFGDIRRRELVEALGFDPSQVSVEQLKHAFEILEFVFTDEKVQNILERFCTDYVKAQHSVTYFHVGGSAVFEVILSAVLVAVTGGVALTATAARSGHKVHQFKKVGELFTQLAQRSPKMRKNKAELKKQTAESRIEDHAGEPAGLKAADNKLPSKPAKSKLPTHREIQLAKLSGTTPAQISAREKVARHYLENNGFTRNQIDTALGSKNGLIDGGVDLTKPVQVVNFPPPDTMTQHVRPHGNPGNWFDPLGNQSADSMGLNSQTRTVRSFKMPQGTGLLSHSKPVVDNWTVPAAPVATQGGGVQLFVNDQIKGAVIGL